jgi:hypothetical protein
MIDCVATTTSITSTASERLILTPMTDGWALMTEDGAVVFRRSGPGARRACLEFARDHGVLSVLT